MAEGRTKCVCQWAEPMVPLMAPLPNRRCTI